MMLQGFSINSLSVRVPHNLSCLVLEFQTPNPLLECFRGCFIDKPMFLVFIYAFEHIFTGKKQTFVFTFSNLVLFYDYGFIKPIDSSLR